MKSKDIRDAFGAVKADVSLKEKILLRAEDSVAAEDTQAENSGNMSRISITGKGKPHGALKAFYAAAAAFALIFAANLIISSGSDDISSDIREETSVTEEIDGLPPENTAEVEVKVVDMGGSFLKNLRVDYFPVVSETTSVSDTNGTVTERERIVIDEKNPERAGTIPQTYDEPTVLTLEYGSYIFFVSDALANDTVSENSFVLKSASMPVFHAKGGSINASNQRMITVDESTREIVLNFTESKSQSYAFPQGEITLKDSEGKPVSDCTVILRPVSGKMAEGYSDIYGGYVLPRTDENGSSVWNYPVEGEYTVIAYKEKLHTADIPVTEPFIIDGDSTFTYVKRESVLPVYKTYRQAEEN